jgi:hypothetical protein
VDSPTFRQIASQHTSPLPFSEDAGLKYYEKWMGKTDLYLVIVVVVVVVVVVTVAVIVVVNQLMACTQLAVRNSKWLQWKWDHSGLKYRNYDTFKVNKPLH